MPLTVETWIEALESGKYEQGKSCLRYEAEDAFFHCCLGVACDLSGVGRWINEQEVFTYNAETSSDAYYLPYPVQSELGLATNRGAFDFDALPSKLQAELAAYDLRELTDSLIDLNDQGVPFNIIAKVIRARPKGLFREDVP